MNKLKPKLLFLNTPDSDYLQDLIFSGLCKLLGKQNIIDMPRHMGYYIPRKVYPRNIGFKSKNILNFFRSTKDYDAVIVGSCSPKCFENYLDILPTIPKNTPVIFLDGGDWPELGGDLKRLGGEHLWREVIKSRPFDLIFKREFLLGQNYPKNVLPLPFCADLDIYPSSNFIKKYDVSFWGVESDPVRTKALTLLENKFDCKENGTTRNQKFYKYKRKGKFYLEELSKCKTVLNFRGAGWDTLRYWETPAMQTFMITQKPKIYIPNDFEHKKHVVHIKDDLSDLIEVCEYYLKHDVEREKIAAAGYEHLLKFHTDIARAQTVLDVIQSKLNLT